MPRLLLFNNAFLFLCCSIYVGVGAFLVFFMLPLEPQLTVDSYYLVFVEPVRNATASLTYMTVLMLIATSIMLASEWWSGLKWPPVIVLLGIIGATLVTTELIFPFDRELAAGVADNARLAAVFEQWADYSRLRAVFWFVQWLAMMYYFHALARRARADR